MPDIIKNSSLAPIINDQSTAWEKYLEMEHIFYFFSVSFKHFEVR